MGIWSLDRLIEFVKLTYRLRREIRAHSGRIVLVHTMGKVGSSSVYHSLKDRLDLPVYHTHFLSREGLNDAGRFFRDRGASMPYNHRFSRVLRRQLNRTDPIIVTLVRDPIARRVSNFFQIGNRVFDSLKGTRERDGSEADVDAVLAEISRQIQQLQDTQHTFVHNWFDNELKSVFGIDVYSRPFDFEKGYVVLSNEQAQVLLFRLEDLDRCFGAGMHKVFGSKDFYLPRKNETRDGAYADLYCQVKERIEVAPAVCEVIYDTRLGRHFYADMAERLTCKWSGQAYLETSAVTEA